MKKLTHSKLCDIGAKWLKTKSPEKCPVVVVEIRSYCPEQPDILGFNGSISIMIEVKMSRSDFKRDAKKFWRMHPDNAVGDYRMYLCPEGIIQLHELPEKWGLLWIDDKGKIEIKRPIASRFISNDSNRFEKNMEYERSIMYSALRRIYAKTPVRGFNK